jgi:hypothetical protein
MDTGQVYLFHQYQRCTGGATTAIALSRLSLIIVPLGLPYLGCPKGEDMQYQKEKSHVVDYHRNPGNTVAARLFRSEYQFKFPENRELGSYPDRYCRHTPHFAFTRVNII